MIYGKSIFVATICCVIALYFFITFNFYDATFDGIYAIVVAAVGIIVPIELMTREDSKP